MSDKELEELNSHIKRLVNKRISEELNWIAEVMKYRDSDESPDIADAAPPHPADLDFSSGSDMDTYWENDSEPDPDSGPDSGQAGDPEPTQGSAQEGSGDYIKSYGTLQKILAEGEKNSVVSGKPTSGRIQSDIEALASKVLSNNTQKAHGGAVGEWPVEEKGLDPETYVDEFLRANVPAAANKDPENKPFTYDDILTKREIMHLLESFEDIYTQDVVTQIIRADRIIKKWKETRGFNQDEIDLLINALEFRESGLFDREIRNLLKMNIIDKVNNESLSTEALACILKIIMSEEN